MEPTTTKRAKQPTKAELREQLLTALARAEEAEEAEARAEAAAKVPVTARVQGPELAKGSHDPLAFLAPTEGVIRVWICTHDEAYKLRLVHMGTDGCTWAFTKWSDGTTYRVHEADGDTYRCTCPGHQGHGPTCNGGKGCKHRRMLQALRQVVDPGL